MTLYISKTTKGTKSSTVYNFPVSLSPFLTKQETTDFVNQELTKRGISPINKVIDGVGVQLNFMVDHSSYIIAGISRGEVLSVNGGKVESTDVDTLFDRAAREIHEETFGVFSLLAVDGKVILRCPYLNKDFPVEFTQIAHLDDDPNYSGMAYVTYSAKVNSLNLNEMKKLAAHLSPTAEFWNKIGNFLDKNSGLAKKPMEEFLKEWNSVDMKTKRANLIAELKTLHQECAAKYHSDRLIIDLQDLPEFKADNFEAGLQQFAQYLENLNTNAAFWKLKNKTIGDYSERPSYHVIATDEMKAALTDGRSVKDIDGKELADVYDSKTVRLLYSDNQNRFKSDEMAQFSDLISKANIDVIFDHDGTMMDSTLGEATRLHQAFKAAGFPEDVLPSIEAIKQTGYGKNGIWFDQMLEKLKVNNPALSNYIASQPEMLILKLKQSLIKDKIDESIVDMGVSIAELPGTGKFLLQVLNQGNDVAVFSGNWDEVVYVALNLHLAKYNISCPAPLDKELHARAKELVGKPEVAQNQYTQQLPRSISAFNDSHQHVIPRKPKPDGLLLQKFSLLLKRGVVKRDELDVFLQKNSAFNTRADYRKTAYIGDDIVDLQAAENAGFDFFIAVNNKLWVDYVQKNNPKIKVIIAENLEQAYELIFKPKTGARLAEVKQTSTGVTQFGQFAQPIQPQVSHMDVVATPKFTG